VRIHLSALTRRAFVTAFRAVGRERLGRDARQHDDDRATDVGDVASLRHVASVPAAIGTLAIMSTVAPPVRKQKPRTTGPGSGSDRPWLVVVKNDNHNTFDGVAFALARTIPGLTFEGGMRLADRIHNTGQAIVWSGPRETAEHYWEQLSGHGLTMAPLEPG
jgi:ATP-dependent Clp protease adaptor protein ClpS